MQGRRPLVRQAHVFAAEGVKFSDAVSCIERCHNEVGDALMWR